MTGGCPLCGHKAVEVFLRRDQVPVFQNLTVKDMATALAVPRGDLHMAACGACGFVFNAAFDPAKVEYGADYDNTQGHSAYFNGYMDELAALILEKHAIRDSTIVEVGCGKGQFLKKLVGGDTGNKAIGFDPSYVGPDSDCDGRLSFRRSTYDDSAADVRADVVICRHVIEHIQQPPALLRAVRSALKASPNALVFFETPCVEWILRNAVIWDLFYEHCSLFQPASLKFGFESAGFDVESVTHTFGGQYLWLAARVGQAKGAKPPGGQTLVDLAGTYAKTCATTQNAWSSKLTDLKKRGAVALWGAGAKGVTFANLLDPDRSRIACVVDISPNKQGRFIPGTGHAIVSPDELAKCGVRSAILLNPNYRKEIGDLLAASGARIDLVAEQLP